MAVKPPMTAVTFGENYDTNQIYTTGIEFAFVGRKDKKWKQATTFVFCKDFLHDAVWAQVNQKPILVHGFQYAPIKGYSIKVPREPLYGSADWYSWQDKYSEFDTDEFTESLSLHLGRTSLLMRNGDLKGSKGHSFSTAIGPGVWTSYTN